MQRLGLGRQEKIVFCLKKVENFYFQLEYRIQLLHRHHALPSSLCHSHTNLCELIYDSHQIGNDTHDDDHDNEVGVNQTPNTCLLQLLLIKH